MVRKFSCQCMVLVFSVFKAHRDLSMHGSKSKKHSLSMAENQKSFFALFQVGHIISLSFSNTFSGAMLIKIVV